MRAERPFDALETVRACEEKSEHGWVLDTVAEPLRASVRALARQGLVERADRETRAELSAWEGRPVTWAVRLSAAGYDLLAYATARPAPALSGPGPRQRLVELLLSQMAALRVFVGLAGQLRTPSAPGLAEQVRTAVHDRGAGRWRLCLTPEQMKSAAYGFWLHKLTGSAWRPTGSAATTPSYTIQVSRPSRQHPTRQIVTLGDALGLIRGACAGCAPVSSAQPGPQHRPSARRRDHC